MELSLFGPGIGECLVVHLGGGDWMVVDSCWNTAGDKAIAVDYLEGLGVDIGKQVKLIVATHWHDDHVHGLSNLLGYASSARFACSVALRCEEFMALVAASDDIKPIAHSSGVSEFAEALKIMRSRSSGRHPGGPNHWAGEGTRLYAQTSPNVVEVHALSPSSQTITNAQRGIARLLPSAGKPVRQLPAPSQNDTCIALLVQTSGLNFLLGADLEAGSSGQSGWQAVLASPTKSCVLSSGYKIAHHGSANADLDAIWTDLLVSNPHAILTPYIRGAKPLPSDEDISRLQSKTDSLYSTLVPFSKTPPTRDKAADKTMKEVLRSRRAMRTPGQIRLRAPINGRADDILVELFNGAGRL